MHFRKDLSIEAPNIVVVITTTTDIVWMNWEFWDWICKDNANAITPELFLIDTSHHSWVPAHFKFLWLKRELCFGYPVNARQQVNHYSPDDGEYRNQQQREPKSWPFARNAKDRSPQISVNKSLGNVGHSFEGQASAALRLLRDIHVGVSAHDNGTGEQSNDAWEPTDLPEEVSCIPSQ